MAEFTVDITKRRKSHAGRLRSGIYEAELFSFKLYPAKEDKGESTLLTFKIIGPDGTEMGKTINKYYNKADDRQTPEQRERSEQDHADLVCGVYDHLGKLDTMLEAAEKDPKAALRKINWENLVTTGAKPRNKVFIKVIDGKRMDQNGVPWPDVRSVLLRSEAVSFGLGPEAPTATAVSAVRTSVAADTDAEVDPSDFSV